MKHRTNAVSSTGNQIAGREPSELYLVCNVEHMDCLALALIYESAGWNAQALAERKSLRQSQQLVPLPEGDLCTSSSCHRMP